jgi:hypothetical protein
LAVKAVVTCMNSTTMHEHWIADRSEMITRYKRKKTWTKLGVLEGHREMKATVYMEATTRIKSKLVVGIDQIVDVIAKTRVQ